MPVNFALPNLAGKAVELTDVSLFSARTQILNDISLTIEYGSHWVLLGANGAGKSSLLSIMSTERFPSQGTVEILGQYMGKVDLRDIRTRIGLVTAKQRVYSGHQASAHTVVLTGFSGSALPLWERYGDKEQDRAMELLALVGCEHLADRHISLVSQGELSRIKLARALMAQPLLLLLDEPYTGLDMPAREDMLKALEKLSSSDPYLSTIVVTHFLEEIPRTTSHAALLREGRLLYAGMTCDIITSEKISQTLGRDFIVRQEHGRYFAYSNRG